MLGVRERSIYRDRIVRARLGLEQRERVLEQAEERFEAPHPSVVFARLAVREAEREVEHAIRRDRRRPPVEPEVFVPSRCGWCGYVVPRPGPCPSHADVEQIFLAYAITIGTS